jgi:hypothetical protein
MKDALLVIGLESIFFGALLSSIKNKKYLFASIIFIFLICFFIFVNPDDARKIVSRDVKNSTVFAWLATSTAFLFAGILLFYPDNNITLTVKRWNTYTHSVLFWSLLLAVFSILKKD